MYSPLSSCLPNLRKCELKQLFAGSGAVHGIDEVKAKNVLPFGQHSHKRTQTRHYIAKSVRILQWLALRTYVS